MADLYETYYWQNDRVRLRLWEPKDSVEKAKDDLDSDAFTFLNDEVCLPSPRKAVDMIGDSPEPDPKAPAFSIDNSAGEYVGNIQFNYINERAGTFSIGLLISKPHRGKGYGRAAMGILLDYAFNERRLHKFNGFCLDENAASAHMMEALGCRREGVLREVAFVHGRYHDQYLYGLTEQEYRASGKQRVGD